MINFCRWNYHLRETISRNRYGWCTDNLSRWSTVSIGRQLWRKKRDRFIIVRCVIHQFDTDVATVVPATTERKWWTWLDRRRVSPAIQNPTVKWWTCPKWWAPADHVKAFTRVDPHRQVKDWIHFWTPSASLEICAIRTTPLTGLHRPHFTLDRIPSIPDTKVPVRHPIVWSWRRTPIITLAPVRRRHHHRRSCRNLVEHFRLFLHPRSMDRLVAQLLVEELLWILIIWRHCAGRYWRPSNVTTLELKSLSIENYPAEWNHWIVIQFIPMQMQPTTMKRETNEVKSPLKKKNFPASGRFNLRDFSDIWALITR